MGAVEDNISLTLAEIKDYLGISGSDHDTLLTTLKAAAVQEADNYLNLPTTTVTIKATIKIWCMKFVAKNFARRELSLLGESVGGAGQTKWELEIPDTQEIASERIFPGIAR